MKHQLLYCMSSLLIFSIFSSSSFANKMEGDESIFAVDEAKVKEKTTTYIEKANKALSNGLITRSKNNINICSKWIQKHKKLYSKDERKEFKNFLEEFHIKIINTEDSLVAVGDAMINNKQIEKATEFITNTLRISGIDQEKFQLLEKRYIIARERHRFLQSQSSID